MNGHEQYRSDLYTQGALFDNEGHVSPDALPQQLSPELGSDNGEEGYMYERVSEQAAARIESGLQAREAEYPKPAPLFGFTNYTNDSRPNPAAAMIQYQRAKNKAHRASMPRQHPTSTEQE